MKHIKVIKNIQRRATKHIIGITDLSNEKRLWNLKLPPLAFRRLKGDPTESYKIINNVYDKEVNMYIKPKVCSVQLYSLR